VGVRLRTRGLAHAFAVAETDVGTEALRRSVRLAAQQRRAEADRHGAQMAPPLRAPLPRPSWSAMYVHRCRARDDFFALVNTPDFTVRWLLERHLAARHQGEEELVFPGFCSACNLAVDFRARFDGAWESPDGLLIPNWRETLGCPHCSLTARGRMM